ncbi:MAG: hypothetical protein ACM3X7_09800 [Solirubrobacterales bacterium]
MKLSDIKTLAEISEEYNIPVSTLKLRLTLKGFDLIEGEDYKKLGPRMPTLLSPEGVKKITKSRE